MINCSLHLPKQKGFTFMEMVVVIVIIGIISAVAVNQIKTVGQTSRVEETKEEMDKLAYAIIGNPDLQNNCIRTDYGYVGDVGSMPPNLDALFSNPGGYASWNGPYIKNSFEQDIDDFKRDAWQADYIYTGSATITSTGSGGSIVRNLAGSIDDLLYNSISGNVLDINGTPPGTIYGDSVLIRLTCPDGAGNMTTLIRNPDPDGYFKFDSIPIGNHSVESIYIPEDDTLRQFVSVVPRSSLYGHYNLASNIWFDPRENINNNIIAYWQLDDAGGSFAQDISGNNYHGSLLDIDTGSAWIAGRIGGALEFDGINDCVLLGDSISVEDQLSVAAWIRPASIGIDRQIASDGYNGAITAWELKLSSADGRVSFRHWGPGEVGVQSNQTLTAGVWTHLIGVYSDGNWQIYWNGVLDNENNALGPVATGREQYIGAIDLNGTPGQFWEGTIDDVRIYDRPLSADEAAALYNLGN